MLCACILVNKREISPTKKWGCGWDRSRVNLSDNLREDIIFDKRPEQLSVNEFIDLTNLVSDDLNN